MTLPLVAAARVHMVTALCSSQAWSNWPAPTMPAGHHGRRKLEAPSACVQIGGVRAPSPVGDLGNQEMTQALPLAESTWAVSGSDMLLQGTAFCALHCSPEPDSSVAGHCG